MKQLVELRDLEAEFAARDVELIAISNEETSLRGHTKVLSELGFKPAFSVLADYDRQATIAYERTTAYFVDREGVVRQVFPMEIYDRAPWWALLNEIDRLDDAP